MAETMLGGAFADRVEGRRSSWTASRAVSSGGRRWKVWCGLLVVPATAILHHALLVRGTCMLNRFGPDYDLHTMARWLSRDPSLPMAILGAIVVFHLGERIAALRPLVTTFVVAFIPLALWIWDIPGTGRIICAHLHDNRFLLATGVPLKGRHLYVLGGVLHPLLLLTRLWVRGHRQAIAGMRTRLPKILATTLPLRPHR